MSLRTVTFSAALLFAGAALAADKPGPNDWPQWRGQHRDGKSPETGLLKSWPNNGPSKTWTAKDLGHGFGTPSVACGKIFGMGTRDGKDGVWALNEADGKELWFTPIDAPKKENQNNGPGSTPTYAEGKLYAVTNNGTLAKLDATSGKVEWTKNYIKDYGASVPAWGFNDSPLVDGDKVICAPSSKKAAVVAFKAATGAVAWSVSVGDIGGGCGYSSPIKTTVGGIPMYVVLLGQSAGIVGIHADTGKLLWQYNKAGTAFGGVAQVPTPIVAEDRVFVSTAYAGGSALLQLIPEGTSKIAVKAIKTYKGDPMNHHGNMILRDGYVYFGHGQNNGIPVCVNFKTGEIAWHADKAPTGGSGSAAYSYADGMLYVRYQNHLMTLVKPSPKEEENKVVSAFKLPEPSGKQSWPHPVIANGKLYIRDQDKLHCFNIKGTTS